MSVLGQLWRFGIVGIANTAIGLVIILTLQNGLGVHPLLSNMVGYLIGFLMGYHFHRTWTFRYGGNAVERVPHYFLVVAICYLLNVSTLTFLTWIGIDPSRAQIVAVVIYSVSHFVLGKWLVFADKKATTRCAP